MSTNDQKRIKLDRIAAILQPQYLLCRTESNYDCLDDEARRLFDIVDTTNVSENKYHVPALQLIARHRDGLVLDFGAGKRGAYLANVVNLEIVAYESTDVISVGERLPFKDGVFDAVHSNAVLEHVKDPFACAREIMRVLKPGGDLMCCVPFLQPYHGYPHHYYNMTHQGVRNLFPGLGVLGIEVYEELRPITALRYLIASWADGLPRGAREQFLNMRLGEILQQPYEALRTQPYVAQLPPGKNQELACCNTLFGRKPGANDREERLVCKMAAYGAGSVWKDVTHIVRTLIVEDRLFISCATDLQPLFGDPAPGVPKQLKVSWNIGANSGETVVSEYFGRPTTPLWL
jgi:SAM-dependent methyltransferase